MSEPITDKTILEKMNAIGDQVKHIQEINDRFKEKYDGLDLQNIKDNSDLAAKKFEELTDLDKKVDTKIVDIEARLEEMKANAALTEEQKKRLDDLELMIAKGGGSAGSDPIIDKEYKVAMTSYLRRGRPFNPELLEKMANLQAAHEMIGADDVDIELKGRMLVKDMISASGPEGGYYLQPERSERILTRIFETSPMRGNAATVRTIADTIEFPIDDGQTTSGWVGEVEARPKTGTPQIGLKLVPVNEVYARPEVTQKLIDDVGFDIEGWLNGKIARDIGYKENTAFVIGDGSKKPRGCLTYPNWTTPGVYQRDAVEQITATGTAGKLDNPDDLINLQSELLEPYQPSAKWAMTRRTFAVIMQLKDENGQYLLDPRMMKTGTDRVLLGAPVILMADFPEIAANNLAVAYADWGQFYLIVDRFGFRTLRDPYTRPPYIGYYTTKRVGGDVVGFEAAKLLKINA